MFGAGVALIATACGGAVFICIGLVAAQSWVVVGAVVLVDCLVGAVDVDLVGRVVCIGLCAVARGGLPAGCLLFLFGGKSVIGGCIVFLVDNLWN